MTPPTATPSPMSAPPASQLVLRDIHLPPPVSWWPPAPGWWILLALLFLLVGGAIFVFSRYRRRRFKRIALRQLSVIEQQLHSDHDHRLCAQKISKLLRHMAVLHYPAEQCAGLYGEDWLHFLDQHFANDKDNNHPFSHDVGQQLIDAPYRPPQQPSSHRDEKQFEQSLALIQLSRRWLKKLPLPPRHGRSA